MLDSTSQHGQKNIYLDTNLWNRLYDQPIDPCHLLTMLASKNARLVLGHHIFYELAKNFHAGTDQGIQRGTVLLNYFKKFVDLRIPWTKKPVELLVAEMKALQNRTSSVDIFLGKDDYARVPAKLNQLAEGKIPNGFQGMMHENIKFSSNARLSQIRHLQNRPDLQHNMTLISQDALKNWVDTETTGKTGVAQISFHIKRQFPDVPIEEAINWAGALQNSAVGRTARGLVRADLYYNWRSANRGSNRPDLYDDIFHVLNAIYCDIYVTADLHQEEYATLLLTKHTRVAIYRQEKPLDDWLAGLL